MTLPVPDLAHFERFCAHLTTDQRAPLTLEPFQRAFLGDYFAGVQETLVLIPKKNGKTTIMAAVALHHLLYVPDAEVYIAAAASKQAGILYGFARRFVNRSPALQKRLLLRPGTYEIRSRRDDGYLKVLAADADTADGVGPTLAIVDELHRHKKADLYDVFSDGLDARDGRMLTISTAGADEDTPLGRMRAKAVAEGTVVKRAKYRKATVRDGSFVMHEWALDPAKDDLDDLKTVKQVNPLRQQTIAKLKRRKESPSMTATRWARLACNVWAQEEDAAISALDWAPLGDDDADLPDGTKEVVVGIDLGWTRDTTAIVPVGVRDDEPDWFDRDAFLDPDLDDDEQAWVEFLPETVGRATIAKPVILTPPGDNRMIKEELIHDALRACAARWPSARYALDPNADGQTIAQWIVRELCGGDDDRVITVSQQPATMAPASMLVAAHVRLGAIRHPNDGPGLNAQLLAAWPRPVGARWRFDKHPKLKKPVDAAIALAMGLRTLRAPVAAAPRPFAISLRRR
jgi:hypothetical protein